MKQTITVVAFGDSITQATHQAPAPAWTEILGQKIQERFPDVIIKLINAGEGGNTTREGLRRIETDVLAHHPDFVCVEFGNDMTYEPDRQIPPEEYITNFECIRTLVAERSKGRLIILTFPPIVDEWNKFFDHEFYKSRGGQDAWQEAYRKPLRVYAEKSKLPLVDIDKILRKKMALHGPEEVILPDGVHINARGNEVIAESVLEVLAVEIEKFLNAK
ncbi:MAG: GDSL-type esterase/lipase family protein [Chthoniobacterales bacterium]